MATLPAVPTIPAIAALPPAPEPTMDEATFAPVAFTFAAAWGPYRQQANALAAAVASVGAYTRDRASDCADLVAIASDHAAGANTSMLNAQYAAHVAMNAPTVYGSTTDSLTVGLGAKTMIIETGRVFAVGQQVVIAQTSNPTTRRMWGVVTFYNANNGELHVDVSRVAGDGTASGWTVTIGSPPATGNLAVRTVAANANAQAGSHHVVTTGGITLSMPASPELDDEISFVDASGEGFLIYWGDNTVKGIVPAPPFFVPPFCAARIKWTGSTWA